jgi:DNA-binding NarL/FixJ family response regulator
MVIITNAGRPTPTSQGGFIDAKPQAHRVLLVDDHPLVRQGLRRIMENEADLMVCAEAGSARDTHTAMTKCSPDVMIAGIRIKHGIELVRDIRVHYPQLRILVLSSHDESIYAERLLSIGANGYIMKQEANELVLLALRRVIAGDVYVSEAIGNTMIQQCAARNAHSSANPIGRLSARELQVLRLVGKGLSTRTIAQFLTLSIKTVDSHRQRIKRKLGLHYGTQLIQYAISSFTTAEHGSASLLPAG